MNSITHIAMLTVLIAPFQYIPVESISCAQCTPSHPACQSGYIFPTPCPENTNKCSTLRIYAGRQNGVIRRCAQQTESNLTANTEMCQDRSDAYPGRASVVICTLVCDYYGCNSQYGPSEVYNVRARRSAKIPFHFKFHRWLRAPRPN